MRVIYGGGGMIRPRFSSREVFRDYRLRNPEIPYAIYGIGLNCDENTPPFSKEDTAAMREWLEGAKSVSVRDEETKRFLAEETGFAKAAVAACPTYAVLRRMDGKEQKKEYAIGISASFGHTAAYAAHTGAIIGLITGLAKTLGENAVCIICHDRADARIARETFGDRIRIEEPRTFEEVSRVYGACRGIVALRGHGVIFSAALGIPCSPIPVSNKLSTLYSFHYGKECGGVSFDADRHLRALAGNVPPREVAEYTEITL
jgi:polysaccharide pyruvyl transferase WcaK-like protein